MSIDTDWNRNEVEAHISLAHDWWVATKEGNTETAARIKAHLAECGCAVETMTFDANGVASGAITMGPGESAEHQAYRTERRGTAPNQCNCWYAPAGF